MRVTERMLFDLSLRRMERQATSVLKGQEQVSSGLRVDRASADPVAATKILKFKKTVEQVDQRLRNTNEAERFLSLSEDIFKDVEGTLHQASELAIDLASAAKTSLDRKNGAHVVSQLFDQMAELANTTHEGQFIFAGDKVTTRPFDFKTPWQGQYVGQPLPLDGVTITAATSPPDPDLPPNDILNVTIDGINIQVVLAEGTYDGDALAVEIQDKINGHPDIIDAVKSVTVGFVLDDIEDPDNLSGRLVITSDTVKGKSSVVVNPPVGFTIVEGINDLMTIQFNGESIPITLTAGAYKEGDLLAQELKTQLGTGVGLPVDVQFDADHFAITIDGSAPFVQALPEQLPLGDARVGLGFLEGKSQLSQEAYLGDDGVLSVFIEPTNPFPKNFPGSVIFRGSRTDAVGIEASSGVDIFASLLNFKAALENDDTVGIQTAIADMNNALEQMSTARAQVGAELDRVDAARGVMEAVKVSTISFQSDEEEIDLTRAISELVAQQNALEASRATAARILSAPTLLDFLR